MKAKFKIIAVSKFGTEEVDSASTLREAKQLCQEYQMAFGPTFTVYIK